jgi:hypothetical protein
MKTLAIDALTGDLRFSGGSPVVLDEPAACVQRVGSRLRWIKGEWFADNSKGLDWDKIFVKNPNLPLIQALIRTEIEDVVNIAAVTSVSVVVDSKTRVATITVTATTDFGTTLTVSETF